MAHPGEGHVPSPLCWTVTWASKSWQGDSDEFSKRSFTSNM